MKMMEGTREKKREMGWRARRGEKFKKSMSWGGEGLERSAAARLFGVQIKCPPLCLCPNALREKLLVWERAEGSAQTESVVKK